MKWKHLMAILVCALCLAQMAVAAADDVPPVVITGLDAYRTNGLKGAYEIWSKGT